MSSITFIIFDLVETLVDETRQWEIAAWAAGIPPFTLAAVLGSLLERGRDHWDLWAELDVDPVNAVDHGYTVTADLFYPDAIPTLRALQASGFRVGIVANQPAGIVEQLEAMDLRLDVVASSTSLGVAKPDPHFFEQVATLVEASPTEIAYVGDRIDNDILPAQAIGMHAVFIRRGPWGHVQARTMADADVRWRIDTLAALPAVLDAIARNA